MLNNSIHPRAAYIYVRDVRTQYNFLIYGKKKSKNGRIHLTKNRRY